MSNNLVLTSTQGFRIFGENTNGQSGYSVSSAGDVNADGYSDVIVGAPYTSSLTGESYVLFGKATGFSDISLSTLNSTQGFRIFGENVDDLSGYSVSSAGDVNKDGYSDVIVGASGAGRSYILFGKATGFSDISLSTLNSTQGFRILGENANDQSGYSVSSAGDVNHDGYSDIIIGAPYASIFVGESYVLFGKATGFSDISLSTLTNTQGFRIFGENAHDHSGSSVSGAGDVNGDGYSDVIIGAYGASNYAGKSYVLFGKATGFSDISLSTLNSTQGFRILGENANDQSGYSVSSAGDVNKDGYADVIIGAFGASNAAGKSYILFGKATGFSDISLSTLTNTQGFSAQSGWSVSSAGDINGDGYSDVIVGAPAASGEGESYVLFGKASGFSDISLSNLNSTQGFKILGENADDYIGYSVSSAGDVNKDGYADVIIGAPGLPNVFSNTGKSYVIFGGHPTLLVTANNAMITYGTIPEFTLSYSGFINSDSPTSLAVQPTVPTITSNPGSYSIIASGGISNNYIFEYIGGGTLTINKAPLIVTANNEMTIYGTIVPTLLSYSGFVNSERPFDLIVQPTVSTAATVTSSPGSYPITVSGGVSNNYAFTYIDGTLTINKASLTVTANNVTTTYGIIPELTVQSYSGFVNSEGPFNLIVQPTVSTTATSTSSPGSYPITVSGGVSNNYAFTYEQGFLNINPSGSEITGDDSSGWGTTEDIVKLIASLGSAIITIGGLAAKSYTYYKPGVLGHNHYYSFVSSMIPKMIIETTANIIREADNAINTVIGLKAQHAGINSKLIYAQLQVAIAKAIESCSHAVTRSDMMMKSAQAAISTAKSGAVEAAQLALKIATEAFELYTNRYNEYNNAIQTSSNSEALELSPLSEIGQTQAPIGIALSYDKIDLVILDTSNVSFDYDDNGSIKAKTSWVGSKDAFLIYDHNNNQQVDVSKELVLTKWSKTATTDFMALKEVFDSNKDNKFDVNDIEFNKFLIWQDKNQDGISQGDELTSLLEAGLIEIDFNTEQTIHGEFFGKQQDMDIAAVLWTDGHQTLAYNLMLETLVIDFSGLVLTQ